MDHGILVVTEDDLDKLFDSDEQPLHNLIPGCNIHTGCYGLFLVALDLYPTKDASIFNGAMRALEKVTDSVLFHSLTFYYPPEDLSYTTLLKLAKCVIILKAMSHGKEAEDISPNHGDRMMNIIDKTLKLKADVIEVPTCSPQI